MNFEQIVMGGLDPWTFSPRTRSVGIHVFSCSEKEDVDARGKPGQGD